MGEWSNFNGDSIYLNMSDYRFYVGTGNSIHMSFSNNYVGIVCEAEIDALRENQINIVEISQANLYTNTS